MANPWFVFWNIFHHDPGERLTNRQFYTWFYANMSAYYASILNMVMIGTDRLIAVTFPLQYFSIITNKMTTSMVMFAWTVPSLYLIFSMVVLWHRMNSLACSTLAINQKHNIFVAFLYLVVDLFVSYISGQVWYVAHQRRQKIRDHWQGNDEGERRRGLDQRRPRNNQTVLTILCSFSCSFLSAFISCIISVSGEVTGTIVFVFNSFADVCMLSNSGINIFVYALCMSDFKEVLLPLINSKCACYK